MNRADITEKTYFKDRDAEVNRMTKYLYDAVGITPEMYGAVGDGIADDTQAFLDLFDYITSITRASSGFKGFNITCLSKIYRITNDMTIDGLRGCTLNFTGELFFDNCNAFTFKRCSENTINLIRVRGDENVENTKIALESLNYNGFEFENCNKNKIYINKILGFHNGFYLTSFDYKDGSTRGCYQNETTVKEIRQCYNCIRILSKDTDASWINENIFKGASLDGVNNIVQGTNGATTQVSNYYHNNKFINIAFEQVRGGDAIILHQGRSNHFLSSRFEGSGILSPSRLIVEGPACAYNLYLFNGYNIDLPRVQLNVSGATSTGSELYGDLRVNTTPIAIKAIATMKGVFYEAVDKVSGDAMNNTLNKIIGEDYLFRFKDNEGIFRKLLYYNQKINYVEDVDLLNGALNFSSESNSTTAKFNYTLKDENTLEIGGVLKNITPDVIFFSLPNGFTADRNYNFTVVVELSDSTKKLAILHISNSDIIIESEYTNIKYVDIGRISIPLITI